MYCIFIYFIDCTFTFSEFPINSRSISTAENNPNYSIWSVWNTCPRNSEMMSRIEKNELEACDYTAYFIYHSISRDECKWTKWIKLLHQINFWIGCENNNALLHLYLHREKITARHTQDKKKHSHSYIGQLFAWQQMQRSNYLFSLLLTIHNSKNIPQTNIARYIHFK